MTTEECLEKAKLLCIANPDLPISNDRKEFTENHGSLIIRTFDQYSTWSYAKNSVIGKAPYNEHHLTTNFLFKTLLPNLADFLGFTINWKEYHYVERIHTDEDGATYDLSTYEPNDPGHYSVWSFPINNGFLGNFETLKYNGVVSTWVIRGLFQGSFTRMEELSAFHKLYIFPHMNSKIVNLTDNHNNKRLLVSGDSQMIPILPFLGTIYEEVWMLDNRHAPYKGTNAINESLFADLSIQPFIAEANFDDVLIAAPLLPGAWPPSSLDKYTSDNFF